MNRISAGLYQTPYMLAAAAGLYIWHFNEIEASASLIFLYGPLFVYLLNLLNPKAN